MKNEKWESTERGEGGTGNTCEHNKVGEEKKRGIREIGTINRLGNSDAPSGGGKKANSAFAEFHGGEAGRSRHAHGSYVAHDSGQGGEGGSDSLYDTLVLWKRTTNLYHSI